MITREQADQLSWIIDCVEAQAKAAAGKPDAHNLMQLGGSLCALRKAVDTITAKVEEAPAADDDGWIEWGGGYDGWPTRDGETLVEVKWRDGRMTKPFCAQVFEWRHLGC